MSLKEARIEVGLSQSELAKLSGVNYRTIQAYEQGRKNINEAKIKTILALASALDVTVSLIVNDDAELKELLRRVENV